MAQVELPELGRMHGGVRQVGAALTTTTLAPPPLTTPTTTLSLSAAQQSSLEATVSSGLAMFVKKVCALLVSVAFVQENSRGRTPHHAALTHHLSGTWIRGSHRK